MFVFCENRNIIFTRKQIINISQTVYVAADSSKFNKDVAIQVCPVNAVDMIITDYSLSKDTINHFTDNGVQLKIVRTNIEDTK
ncbi:hypothetical protein [Lysinibacillus sp. NPDC056185]|uniref:hypothetical protein n=1 Tax=Lysinibacillus sp. NPDC056185 TaxID=3345739 RepID=UPI0039F126E7